MNIFRFYDYIYYRRYMSGSRGGTRPFWDEWAALNGIGLIVLLNIFGTVLLIQVLTGIKILEYISDLTLTGQFVIGVVLLIPVAIRWGPDSNRKRILAQFASLQESKRQKLFRCLGIWAYILAWGVLSAICLIIIMK